MTSEDSAYFVALSRHRLLTRDDEARLGAAIRAGNEAASSGAPDDPDLARERARLIRAGDQARTDMVNANLRLVVSIARRYMKPGRDMHDIIQCGNIGLLYAADRFDERKGFKFSTYATWWVKQAIGRGVNDAEGVIRVPPNVADAAHAARTWAAAIETETGRYPEPEEMAAEFKLSPAALRAANDATEHMTRLDAPVGDSPDSDTWAQLVADPHDADPADIAVDNLFNSRAYREVRRRMKSLSDAEQAVLVARFGLDGNEPQSLQAIATQQGVSPSRISTMLARAFRELAPAARLRHGHLDDLEIAV